MSATASSTSALLPERAQQWPDAPAYTPIDYDVDSAGEYRSRFSERFAPFNLPATALRPYYGLTEAMVYVASPPGRTWTAARFDYQKLSAGHGQRCGHEQTSSELVSHCARPARTMRIVDAKNRVENPAGMVGDIWVHGDNVAAGSTCAERYRQDESTRLDIPA
jgi:hypothetical protein